jgi:hypothetical protein
VNVAMVRRTRKLKGSIAMLSRLPRPADGVAPAAFDHRKG